ncbi:MAG: hypothetical protein IAG13_05245 [Deltaproteobacteria bacterium]|nr:hypothetical protein [Nannocystaceae bacterium]
MTTLRANPELVWFSVMMVVASSIVAGVAGSLAWGGSHATLWLLGHELVAAAPESVAQRAAISGGLLTWFAAHLAAPFFGVALARATLEALAQRPWTVSGSLGESWRRMPSIATYAVLDASVGGLLGRLRRGHGRGGSKLAAQLLGLAWWAATYLTLPVLAREPRGGMAAVSRSTTLMRETWKEAFVGRLVLGWIWLPLGVLAGLPLAICLALGIESKLVLALAVVLPSIGMAALIVVLRTLDTIYRCALYVFATEGVVPEPFDDPELEEIWCVRPQ